MPLTVVCGAECQLLSAGGLAGNDDEHWTDVLGGAIAAVTSPVRTGSYAYHFTADSAGDSFFRNEVSTETDVGYARFYFRLPSLTVTNEPRLFALESGGAPRLEVHLTTGGVIRLETFAGTQSSTNNFSPSVDTWYGVEMESVQGVGGKWRVWNAGGSGAWSTSESVADATQTTVGGAFVGLDASDLNFQLYLDDIAIGFGSTAGELYDTTGTNGVDGFVLRLNPASDGTHSIGTSGDFTGNPLTPIVNGSTTAYGNLDAADIEQTTDYIESESGATTAEYVEVNFADEATYDSPRGVQVMAAYEASTGTPTPGNLDISDDGSTWDTAVSPGSVTSGTPIYARTMLPDVPSDASAWTKADINALRARFYGNDATGANARLTALVLEVEWTNATPNIYARPDGDESSANWATAPLWSKVDEDPDSPDGTTITVSIT